ncbi:MAG: PIN domain-containing protein, partial [Pseudomonadota bacterium]
AGAATARALIVTLNMRDFPARRLTPHGLEAVHPDGLLWGLLEEETERFVPVVGNALADLARPVGDGAGGRNALKRAGLGRLGKAWAAQMA